MEVYKCDLCKSYYDSPPPRSIEYKPNVNNESRTITYDQRHFTIDVDIVCSHKGRSLDLCAACRKTAVGNVLKIQED